MQMLKVSKCAASGLYSARIKREPGPSLYLPCHKWATSIQVRVMALPLCMKELSKIVLVMGGALLVNSLLGSRFSARVVFP